MIPIADQTSAPALAPVPVAAAPAYGVPAPLAAAKAATDFHAVQPALALQAEPVRPAPPPAIAAITPAPEPGAPKSEAAPVRSNKVRTGWIVQVGAFATVSEAKQHLDEAQTKANKLLSRADPFTEPVTKDDKTYYRARFSGLERDQAEAACRQLRRSDIDCIAVKN